MSAAFVLTITDGQDTQKPAEDFQQTGYVIGLASRARRASAGRSLTGPGADSAN